MLRDLARVRLLVAFLSGFRWFRRIHGGRWEFCYIDFPVAGFCWIDIPSNAPADYREGLWRGNAADSETWP